MSNNIIVQFSEDEFKRLLKSCIAESLENSGLIKSEPSDKLFNVNEASKKLYFRKSDLEKWLSEGRKQTKEEIENTKFKKEKGGKHG